MLAREIKAHAAIHFLINEHGDLSFFLHNFDEIIIFFELHDFLKTFFARKKCYREKHVQNPSLVGAKL